MPPSLGVIAVRLRRGFNSIRQKPLLGSPPFAARRSPLDAFHKAKQPDWSSSNTLNSM